jgi:hypothetical protein
MTTPISTAVAETTVEGATAAVLGKHLWHHTRETHCICGFRTPLAQLAVEGYLQHVAAELAAAGLLATTVPTGPATAKV